MKNNKNKLDIMHVVSAWGILLVRKHFYEFIHIFLLFLFLLTYFCYSAEQPASHSASQSVSHSVSCVVLCPVHFNLNCLRSDVSHHLFRPTLKFPKIQLWLGDVFVFIYFRNKNKTVKQVEYEFNICVRNSLSREWSIVPIRMNE